MKKKLLIVFAGLLLILAAVVAGAYFWLQSHVKRENIVALMEREWNCRAQIDSTRLELFSSPARVEILGLKLAPRDLEVGKALDQRAALDPASALLSANEVSLSVALTDLINRKASVKDLHIETLLVQTDVDQDGESTLDIMFDDPDDYEFEEVEIEVEVPASAATRPWQVPAPFQTAAAASTNPSEPAKVTPGKKKKKIVKRKRKKKERKKLKAQDLVLALAVGKASVENAQIDVRDHGGQTRTFFDKVNLTLKDIDVNPAQLATQNRCGFDFSGVVQVSKPAENLQITNFEVVGEGQIRPFEVTSGEWRPDVDFNVTIKKGGLLGAGTLWSQLKKKDRDKIKEYGMNLEDLSIGGVLLEDAVTSIHAVGSKLIIKKDTLLSFPQYQVLVTDGSWVNSQEDLHILRGVLTVSAELTARMLTDAQASLTDRFGENLAELATTTVKSALLDEQKRLVLPFRSRGKLSKPEVSLDTVLGDAADVLKKAGRSLLDSLLGE